MEGLLVTLVADGFAPLQQSYLQAWLHTDQQVLKYAEQPLSSLDFLRSACIPKVQWSLINILMQNGHPQAVTSVMEVSQNDASSG